MCVDDGDNDDVVMMTIMPTLTMTLTMTIKGCCRDRG